MTNTIITVLKKANKQLKAINENMRGIGNYAAVAGILDAIRMNECMIKLQLEEEGRKSNNA